MALEMDDMDEQERYLNRLEFDELVASLQAVEIGTKVTYVDDPTITGTIIAIALRDFPFKVIWTDGSADWFKGSQLRL